MNGALLDQARADFRNIVTEGGFQTPITFVSRDNVTTVIIDGEATLHNTQIDPETGTFTNMRTAHVLIVLQSLIDEGFPVYSEAKNGDEPYLQDVKVSFVDAQGFTRNFIVDDPRPSHTFGGVTINLKSVKP